MAIKPKQPSMTELLNTAKREKQELEEKLAAFKTEAAAELVEAQSLWQRTAVRTRNVFAGVFFCIGGVVTYVVTRILGI